MDPAEERYERQRALELLRSGAAQAVVIAVVLLVAIDWVHDLVLKRRNPTEDPDLVWIFLFIPGLFFVLGIWDLCVYLRAKDDPSVDLSKMHSQSDLFPGSNTQNATGNRGAEGPTP